MGYNYVPSGLMCIQTILLPPLHTAHTVSLTCPVGENVLRESQTSRLSSADMWSEAARSLSVSQKGAWQVVRSSEERVQEPRSGRNAEALTWGRNWQRKKNKNTQILENVFTIPEEA